MKSSLIKSILCIFISIWAAACISAFIRYQTLPKVYAIPQSKGVLSSSSIVYDCVVPKSALTGDSSLYFAYSIPSPSGKRSIAFRSDVKIIAEDQSKIAISVMDVNKDWLIVISYDGKLEERSDVVILRPAQ